MTQIEQYRDFVHNDSIYLFMVLLFDNASSKAGAGYKVSNLSLFKHL